MYSPCWSPHVDVLQESIMEIRSPVVHHARASLSPTDTGQTLVPEAGPAEQAHRCGQVAVVVDDVGPSGLAKLPPHFFSLLNLRV